MDLFDAVVEMFVRCVQFFGLPIRFLHGVVDLEDSGLAHLGICPSIDAAVTI